MLEILRKITGQAARNPGFQGPIIPADQLLKMREDEIRSISERIVSREETIRRLEEIIRGYELELNHRASIIGLREERIRQLEDYIRKIGH